MSYFDVKITGKKAMFTDPISKIGGEKTSYHIPTRESLKGLIKSVYWKPTFDVVIDKFRVMNEISTHTETLKGIHSNSEGNVIYLYTYLVNVCYHVRFHLEWEEDRKEFEKDRNYAKHSEIMRKHLMGRWHLNPYLGTSECRIEDIGLYDFDKDNGFYDDISKSFGIMFREYEYPKQHGKQIKNKVLFNAFMNKGVVNFSEYDEKFVSIVKNQKFGAFTNNVSIFSED